MAYKSKAIENIKNWFKRYNILCDDSINNDILMVNEFYTGGKYITVEIASKPEIYNNHICLNSIGIDPATGIDPVTGYSCLCIEFYINSDTKNPEIISITKGGNEGLDFNLTNIHIPLHLSIINGNINIITEEYFNFKQKAS